MLHQPCSKLPPSEPLLQALSDFAEYVQKQQSKRDAKPTAPPVVATGTAEHAELDILDSLDLSDDLPRVRLKRVLLNTSEESTQQLKDILAARLDEGHGETLFDIGLEDSGESMGFDGKEWECAYGRVVDCAEALHADCRILMTQNVGGALDVEADAKNKGASGKLLIRRRPDGIDDVIETRIAVVGNGAWMRRPDMNTANV